MGCDFSGYVVKAGQNVTSPAVGDHVAGFLHGSTFSDEGAFSEYVKTPGDLVWVVPENTLSHDEAATFGCACVFLFPLPRGYGKYSHVERPLLASGQRRRRCSTRSASLL